MENQSLAKETKYSEYGTGTIKFDTVILYKCAEILPEKMRSTQEINYLSIHFFFFIFTFTDI